MGKYVTIALVLQVLMVLAGHYNDTVLQLSGPLGVGIPLAIGAWFGATAAPDYKGAAGGGFVIGLVGAVVGILIAIMLGDAEWILLAFGPLSSAVTGVLGALVGFALVRAKKVATQP